MSLKVVSAVVLSVGIVILVALLITGGLVYKEIKDEILSRLIYKLPSGYKHDPDFEVCPYAIEMIKK